MNPARSRPAFPLFCIICSHTEFHKAWANTNRTMWQYFIFVLHMWKRQCKLWEHSAPEHQQIFQVVCTPLPLWRIMAFLLFLRQRGTWFSLLSFLTDTTGTEGYYLPASGTKAASQIWISSELSLLTNRLWNHRSGSWQSQPCLCPGNREQLLPSAATGTHFPLSPRAFQGFNRPGARAVPAQSRHSPRALCATRSVSSVKLRSTCQLSTPATAICEEL